MSKRPSTSLRYAQGEQGMGEIVENSPFLLSPSPTLRTGYAAYAAKSKHGSESLTSSHRFADGRPGALLLAWGCVRDTRTK